MAYQFPFTVNKSGALPFGPAATELTVWVEWAATGHGTSDLHIEPLDIDRPIDSLRFHAFQTILMVLGGENQGPELPRSINDNSQGIYVMMDPVYQQGYDVFMMDEDQVDNDGSGDAFDEIQRAVTQRGVTQIAIFGYSHGGGSTHDLAERLNAQSIGTIAFTSYIDAIENDGFFDTDSETRLPPSSQFHVNDWQPNPSEIFPGFNVNGAPTVGGNINRQHPDHVHSTIDNDATIHTQIRSDFFGRQLPR